MAISPLAGKPADPSLLINVPRLVTAYYTGRPDPSVPLATRRVWNFRASRLRPR
jgi:hypothetical protein